MAPDRKSDPSIDEENGSALRGKPNGSNIGLEAMPIKDDA
jgi:hypothetical protein